MCCICALYVCVCSQQDAQEFLIALLEGLQDDLNRVRDKNKKRHIDCSSEVETIRQDGVDTLSLSGSFFFHVICVLLFAFKKSTESRTVIVAIE